MREDGERNEGEMCGVSNERLCVRGAWKVGERWEGSEFGHEKEMG